ncbi:unnamed protein product [Bursaphelenchus xylophilus]|uniref:Translation initiation factor eIF2B subunit alpha n=1 Tax=Bursaphelenchus xylophilus TaxID=6326 RepID=A0A1I7RRB7_BURXY|nr:unnamed protein product [Bursaphelenchus xylophilus]CAG9130922.1 unnamed protein product [Bursaphelenchus xylophilus]
MDESYDEVQQYFSRLLQDSIDGRQKSTGLAAIETLMMRLGKSKATTVRGLTEDLDNAVNAMLDTDYSAASIQSASELFLRFISLISVEQLDDPNFAKLMKTYKERGTLFIKRISMSRQMIAEFSVRFIQHNVKVLVHSFSQVVLGALLAAKRSGNDFQVFVTESQPDASGKKMIEELNKAAIDATLVLDSATGYLMERIDLVLLGAEGVMETGGIINKIGSLGISICANTMNKPVYVLAESIKFVKEYPLNQSDIPNKFKYRSSTLKNSPQQLKHEHPLTDYTPPEYIHLLVTDLGIFTPAAVGDELIKLYT